MRAEYSAAAVSQLTKREHLQTSVSIANISDEVSTACEDHRMTGVTWQH